MMNLIKTKGLSFDDVLIVPQFSTVRSRGLVDVSTKVGNASLDIPLIAANMDTVCGVNMARSLDELGGCGVVHRGIPLEDRFACVADIPRSAVAFGVNENLDVVIDEANKHLTSILVLDIAHGHSQHALDAIKYVKDGLLYDPTLVGGNVATFQAVVDFAQAGVHAVKVGIGPGSVCSTRIVTGVGVPQLTAIEQCAEAATMYDISVIADGGIRHPGDAAKALAAGADAVMIGNMFAGTLEAEGEIVVLSDGSLVKGLRGMASSEAGSAYPEGVSAAIPFKGPVSGVVDSIVKGIKSSMSYVGAYNLLEFQAKAGFIQISNAGLQESAPHDILNIHI